MIVKCDYCGSDVEKHAGHVNRAKKMSNKLYCNMTCAGLGKRCNRTNEEKKEIKRLYDLEYRTKNHERIKQRQQKYNSSPAGRDMQKRQREKREKEHLEYCQTPEYREWKRKYDREYQAKKTYGEFWEAFIFLRDIENEIDNREVKQQLNLNNKSQKRKRDYERFNSSKLEAGTLGNPK
jgi:hypothetical protein